MDKQAKSEKAVVATMAGHNEASHHVRAQSWRAQSWNGLTSSYLDFTLATPPALMEKESPWQSTPPTGQSRAKRNLDSFPTHDHDSRMTDVDGSLVSFASAWNPEQAKMDMDFDVLGRRVAIILAHQQAKKPQTRTLGCNEDSGRKIKTGRKDPRQARGRLSGYGGSLMLRARKVTKYQDNGRFLGMSLEEIDYIVETDRRQDVVKGATGDRKLRERHGVTFDEARHTEPSDLMRRLVKTDEEVRSVRSL
ncbi:hypothetical protein RBB50_012092 [Rhinocladiella similis]